MTSAVSPCLYQPPIARIVIINDLSRPQGGASLLALRSAQAFAARQIPVTVIAGDEAHEEVALDRGIEWVHLGAKRLLEAGRLRSFTEGIYNRRAYALIADWISVNDRPGTIYHLHGWSQILSSAVFAALCAVEGRVIMTAHDFFLRCPNGAIYDYRAQAPCPRVPMSRACLLARCDRRSHPQKMWRSARHLVQERQLSRMAMPPQLLIHESMGPLLERGGVARESLAVLPNPVVPFCPRRVPAEKNRSVLFVGRLESTKGVDLAAKACRAAGAHLIAVGDGELLAPMRTAYPEMDFVGRKKFEDIAALASGARMLVMPSRHPEPFGLSAVEALGSGLPVIVSRASLLSSNIDAAGAGFAVDPYNELEFAGAIRTLQDDDDLTRAMSLAALQLVGRLALEPDRWIDAMLEAYRALLRGDAARLREISQRWMPVEGSAGSSVIGGIQGA